MKINKLFVLLLSLFLMAGATVPLCAQSSVTGAIAGTVSDSTGAVIPGATVVVTNADTGQQRTVTTGANGSYIVPLLQPGTYNVKFTANGFKTTEVNKLTVAVTETPVLDQKLDLGTQSEQVTVEANAEAIQTTNSTLGTVIGGSQVTALPLTSRNYTNILSLSAGVSALVTNASTLGKGGLDFQVNGASSGSNNIQIDGANVASLNGNNSNQDQLNGYGVNPVPNPDSLQEFKIQTSNYDAGSGRNSGANVNVITKSGTNAFHGSGFEFFRNTALNANDFFLNRAGKAKGVLNQNQFGGSVGGPIKKDKLFFFMSYQGTTQKNGLTTYGNSTMQLPPMPSGDRSNTAAFQAGLGAAFCPANHPGSTLYNTNKGGVQVACDGSNINPIAINLLQAKLPNGTYLLPGSTTGAFQSTNVSIPARFREDQGLANLDYILSQKHTLAVRFFTSYAPTLTPFWQGSVVPGFASHVLYNDTTGLVKLTSVLTPSVVNEARVSWHLDVANFTGNDSGISDHQFGITPLSVEQDFLRPGFMTSLNITGAYQMGAGGFAQYAWSKSYSYQATDQISLTRGIHTIRAGFDMEQDRWFRDYPGIGSGQIAILSFADFLIGRAGCTPGDTACTPSTPTTTNGQPNNGTAFTNMGSSTATSSTVGPGGNAHSYRLWNASGFVNDDIKLSQRLTLNVGMRYEYLGITSDRLGNYTDIWQSAILTVPVPGNSVATGTLAGWVVPANYKGPMLPGLTRASNDSSLQGGPPKDNWAPRIGFAWQPFGGSKFVVRGGYGFFFDRIVGVDMITGVNNGPPLAPANYFSGSTGYASTLAVPYRNVPVGSYPVRWVDLATGNGSAIGQRFYNSVSKTPMTQSYNLNIQYNFLPSLVLEVGYVGNHAIHLEKAYNPNWAAIATPSNPVWGITNNTVVNSAVRVPYLGFAAWTYACTCFSERYNSLQVTLRKQFSHGFQAQAAYTWNKEMDNTFEPNYLGGINNQYGVSGRPQRLSVNYNWNLPFGKPKGMLGKVVSGWNLSGVTTIQSGSYLTISDGRGGTIYGLSTSRAQLAAGKTYADIASPGSLGSRLGGGSLGCGYFNCGANSPFTTLPNFVTPDGTVTNGTYQGNMGQGVILGPGQFNFDASLSKTNKVGGIHEDATLQFRAEFFNMFNHAQFSNPSVNLSSAGTFGQITTTTVNPRVIQLALKYAF